MSIGVVIGHGRSPEGQRWGKRIDKCDIVVRMWNCEWHEHSDLGTKYDYGLIEASPSIMKTFYDHNRRQPERGWIASKLHNWSRCNLPAGATLIDQAPWNEIGKRLGGVGATGNLQFTRGTIAACWLIGQMQPGDQIILVGFDDICRGVTVDPAESFAPASLKSPGSFPLRDYRGGITKYGNHDYPCERRVLQYLASQRGVRILFAQELWGLGDVDLGYAPVTDEGGAVVIGAEIATRRPLVLLIGDAACVHEDIEAALALFKPDEVAAVNCIGINYAGHLDYWFTLHPDAIEPWPGIKAALRRRAKNGGNRPETWAHKPAAEIDRDIPDWGGASGLFAIRGLLSIGRNVVCAGIPMVAAEGHFYDKAPWKWAERARKGWVRHQDEISPYVRSMSGWTRELLGAPDQEWLGATAIAQRA